VLEETLNPAQSINQSRWTCKARHTCNFWSSLLVATSIISGNAPRVRLAASVYSFCPDMLLNVFTSPFSLEICLAGECDLIIYIQFAVQFHDNSGLPYRQHKALSTSFVVLVHRPTTSPSNDGVSVVVRFTDAPRLYVSWSRTREH